MSYQAYQSAQRQAESPRELEYRLFAQVTRALMEAEAAGRENLPKLVDAVDWNRRLWSALATDCSDPGNALGQAARAQIISLSLFVGRYSSDVIQSGAELEPLIDINRTIMQGLAGQRGDPPAEAA
jgi:flagellar biosynthesis activator protein FlaF